MKLVVGLGNPGAKYENTRHNIGFKILDDLNLEFKYEQKFEALVSKKNEIIYLKPQTYMNLSGMSVSKALNFYKISVEDLYVIHDDIDLPFGVIRFKKNSSHGGQNGVKNIIELVGTNKFNRLKVGIGRDKNIPVENYVLSKFSTLQNQELSTIISFVKLKMKELCLLWI